jgi:superoxide dismutase, Fe-Mn family
MERRQLLQTLVLAAAASPLSSLEAFAQRAAAPAAPTAPAGPFSLPPLPYAFDALEPHFDALTMQIHYGKHHAAYVANLNKAVMGRKEVEGWSLERLLRELPSVPEDIRTAVRNHGGGHANHTLFWVELKRDGAKKPVGELAGAIDSAFGSFDGFRSKFDAAAGSVFGSGWAWLVAGATGAVRVTTTPNQDSPLTSGDHPLLGIDVWEHAYYLKYQNRRAEYVAAFHQVLDWDAVSARYREARKG